MNPTRDLIARLRGTYTVPVNDGGGLLDGKDTFTRQFPAHVLPPIHGEAAAALEKAVGACRAAYHHLDTYGLSPFGVPKDDPQFVDQSRVFDLLRPFVTP